VNHRLGPAEIEAVLAETEPSVLIQHASVGLTPVPSSVQHRISVAGSLDQALDFDGVMNASLDDPIDEAVGLDDLCLLPHTSGTTGGPKVVMLSHANVTWNVVNLLGFSAAMTSRSPSRPSSASAGRA
jgi:fatty-acyl-CoA synthase